MRAVVYKFPYYCVLKNSKIFIVKNGDINIYILFKRNSLNLDVFLERFLSINDTSINENEVDAEEDAICLVISQNELDNRTLNSIDDQILLFPKEYELNLVKEERHLTYDALKIDADLNQVKHFLSFQLISPCFKSHFYDYYTCQHDKDERKLKICTAEEQQIPENTPNVIYVDFYNRFAPVEAIIISKNNGKYDICLESTPIENRYTQIMYMLDERNFHILSPNVAVYRKTEQLIFWFILKDQTFCFKSEAFKNGRNRERSLSGYAYTTCLEKSIDVDTMSEIESVFYEYMFYDLTRLESGISARDALGNLMLFGTCSEDEISDVAGYLLEIL